ncbi:ribosomal protein S6 kinase-like 1 isoform X1 [Sphaerodactylus townsendi]|uniref:ribosomal protein S6 kinase-like 1 isoform X1 n=1 Tax=Sphaerodactylus townsendi TaxID=933632 RepID=UPI0020260526|nr:ribosomal protein S6 kinase-like 1 isoform X1 [Sphaerodactylus townsendi]XP_048341646.1 ribosomal protein S6 kinase-like 1 isoform X1 [Sphaerodactylus townsendi]XP_048341647.1 ribosomal protein S6 kinase-like 1 isoform X1 [Sphaerodactylus townsendi]
MESEYCTQAFSQARVYLEQIRSRVTPGSADVHGTGKRDYLLDAAKQIRLALERDVNENYEEAFNHYKNGVDVLLNGVQVDPNKERREAVKRKITQYLKRAEEIFICHLQRTSGNGNSTNMGYSSLRFRPIRTLRTPVENLRHCKVVGVIDKVQIVQDPATGKTFILKSLTKSYVETCGRQTIIPHGIPFMTELLRYYVSEDSIFLHLEHVKGGTLWSHLHSQHNSSNCSSTNLKSSFALEHAHEEELIGSPQRADSRLRQSCNSTGQISTSVNHYISRYAEQSHDHTHVIPSNDHRWHTSPVIGGNIVGGKNLSVTPSLAGAAESTIKPVGQEHCLLANQRLSFLPHNTLHSSVPERETSQQNPKQETCERASVPVPKAAKGNNLSLTATPCRRIPRLMRSPATLSRQRHACPGTVIQNCCSLENQWSEAEVKERGCLAQEVLVPDKEQHKQPSPGHYGPPAHQASNKNDPGVWGINEDQIQHWAAEVLLALEGLHQQGVFCQDLNPRNLLLDASGHIRLTYFGRWTEVEPQYCSQALEELYCAPEVGGISELTDACDWWSFGALLYELLSGTSLSQNHPSGIYPHTQLHLPERLSHSASCLLSELLKYDPKQRLGSGKDGVKKIKAHPFFSNIQWNKLVA